MSYTRDELHSRATTGNVNAIPKNLSFVFGDLSVFPVEKLKTGSLAAHLRVERIPAPGVAQRPAGVV